jgi:Fe-S cluster assembly ATPase SufC
MMDGKIIKTGNLELIEKLEKEGYNGFSNEIN